MELKKVSVVKKILTIVLPIIGIVVVLIGFIWAIGGLMGVSTIEEALLGFAFLGLGMGIITISENMGYKFCKKCRTKMDGCAYEYRTTRHFDKKDSKGNLKMRMTEVQIVAECPGCGKKKKFKKAFKSYNYDSGENYDVETSIDNFCFKKFGH